MNLLPAKRHQAGPATHEIAAAWVIREEEGRLSPASQLRRDDWLGADPANRRAFEDVRQMLMTAAQGASDPEVMAMRARALGARSQIDRTPQRIAAGVLAVALIGGVGWWVTRATPDLPAPRPAAADPASSLYRTAVGERAAVTLPDGSVAMLDTDSVLKVDYTGAERGVRLLRGQALFEVAKHKALPFQVYVGQERVTAVGTKFDVRLDGKDEASEVRVALVEGVLNVTTLAAAQDRTAVGASVTMAAGEVLEARPLQPLRVMVDDTDQLTSWCAGVLTFDDLPLDRAVTEVNRYTTHSIALSDPKLSRLRISGVFRAGDPEHFADTVADAFPVRVVHKNDGSVDLEPR